MPLKWLESVVASRRQFDDVTTNGWAIAVCFVDRILHDRIWLGGRKFKNPAALF